MAKRWNLKTPKSVGEVLAKVLHNNNFELKMKEYRIWEYWKKIVGEKIYDKCSPVNFQNGYLFVNVVNSAWVQQLVFMKDLMIQKINEHLNIELVKDIHFKVGNVEILGKKDNIQRELLSPKQKKFKKHVDEKKCAELVQNISDQELKAQLHRLVKKSLEMDN